MSLRNLGLDRIDLYQLHSIDPTVPLVDQVAELRTLQEEGKIRHIGLSSQPGVSIAQLAQAASVAPISSVENLYNVADRTDEDVVRYAEKHDIAYICYWPLGSGRLLASQGALKRIADDAGVTPAQLALAWLLRDSPRTLPIPGTTSIAHMAENMRALEVVLDEGKWDEIGELCKDEAPQRPTAPTRHQPDEHPHLGMLRTIYADFTTLGNYADDDIVLHPAWRTARDPGDLVGKATALARQDALLKSHRGTMVMEVESISANDRFGTVLGTIRTEYPQVAAIPFCGVWRFRNGRIVEHWENAYNAQDDVRKLTQGHE